MRIVLHSNENDECSPLETCALLAILANHMLNNKCNDGSGNAYGGSLVVGCVLYNYEVTPKNNLKG